MDRAISSLAKEISTEFSLNQSEKRKAKSVITILLGMSLLLGTVAPLHVYSTVSFDSEVNLSNTAGVDSTDPKVVATGTNVYIAWQEGSTSDIFLNASSDSGSTFLSGTKNLSNDDEASNQLQITAKGDTAYVVWRNDTTDDDVYFIRTTDGGSNFDEPINLSDDTTDARKPQIATVGSNVYVVWENHTSSNVEIVFRNSTSSGAAGSFSPLITENATNISDDTTDSVDPQIVASGSNVYIVWQNDTSSGDIYLAASTDSGKTFPTITQISDDPESSIEPKIAASGSQVYVIWRNDTSPDNIAFSNSTDNGVTFGTPINISNSTGHFAGEHAIAAEKDSVYITWADRSSGDDIEILFTASKDKGDNFITAKNIGQTSGDSREPQVNATGTNVYITWRDDSTGDNDILFTSSVNNGDSFCGNPKNLSDNGVIADNPQVASTGSVSYVTWDEPVGGNDDVSFLKGTTSTVCFQFDKNEYRLSETAKLNVTSASSNTDPNSKESIEVDVISSTDGTGIDLSLEETEKDSAVFEGTMTFTTGTSSGSTLQVSKGDTITAKFGGNTGTASIFSVTFNVPDRTPFLDDVFKFTITDQNSNKDKTKAETIKVTVSSETDTSGVPLTLTETGVNTATFSPTGLVFTEGDNRFSMSDTLKLEMQEKEGFNEQNKDPNAIDKIEMFINSTSDKTGLTVKLTETGPDTGLFRNETKFTSGASTLDPVALKAAPGDLIRLTFNDASTYGLITPNDDAGLNNLEAVIGDDVTITFGNDKDSNINIVKQSGSGGGGGALVRPSLVLDVVAGASALGGGSGDRTQPLSSLNDWIKVRNIEVPDHIKEIVESQDPEIPVEPLEVDESFDLPLTIADSAYPIGSNEAKIQTKSVSTGEPVTIKTMFYERSELEHASIYLNLRDDKREDYLSDTQILFNRDEPIQIIDKNGYFDSVNVRIEEDGDLKKFAIFEITFAKPMEKTDLIYKGWDPDRRGTKVTVRDALEIKGEPITEPQEQLSAEPKEKPAELQELKTEVRVPGWIKKNAGWWSEGQINDSDFVKGVEHLMTKEIITIPDLPESETEVVQDVPDWVKNNAGWWSQDLISDGEFVNGIKYLVEKGIIQVAG